MNFYPIPLARAVESRVRALYSWRGLVVLFLLLSIWGWFDVRRRGVIDPADPLKHKTDLTVYTEAGAAFFDGRDPYRVSSIRGWTYLYPPLFAMLLAPLHHLPSQEQVLVWFGLSLIVCWGCYRECRSLIRHVASSDDAYLRAWSSWFPWLGVASFCAAVLPTMNCLQRGQVGILKFYLLLLGVRLILAGEKKMTRFLGGVVLALPIVLKIVPALPAGFFVFALLVAWVQKAYFSKVARGGVIFGPNDRSPQECIGVDFFAPATGLVAGLLLFFFFVPSMMVGWTNNYRNLQTWSQFVLAKADDGGEDPRSGNSRAGRNQSLQNAVFRLGNFADHAFLGGLDDCLAEKIVRPRLMMDAPVVEGVMLAVRFAILGAIVLLGVRLGRRGDQLSLVVAFSVGCMAMLVVSPVSRGHYFMLVCPAVLFVPWWLLLHGRFYAALVLALLPVTLIDVHYALMPVATRVGLLGLGTSLWLFAALIVIAQADSKGCTSSSFVRYPGRENLLPAKQAA